MSENKILSQADIDALLGGGASTPAPVPAATDASLPTVVNLTAPAPAPAPPPPPPQAPVLVAQPAAPANPTPPAYQPPPQPASVAPEAQASSPAAASPDLLARLERAEASLTRMREVEFTVRDLTQQLALMQGQFKHSFGASARQRLTCGACHTQGQVAVRVRCTSCGEEHWWGWWPKEPPLRAPPPHTARSPHFAQAPLNLTPRVPSSAHPGGARKAPPRPSSAAKPASPSPRATPRRNGASHR